MIVGFGAGGRTLAKVLAEAHVAYQVIEADAEIVARGRLTGEPILYGDLPPFAVLLAALLVTALSLLAYYPPRGGWWRKDRTLSRR